MAQRKKSQRASAKKSGEGSALREMNWESVFASFGRIEVVLLAGSVMLLLVLIYTIQSILSPLLALCAILFILFPLRRHALARNVMWLAIGLFALWFINSVSMILVPFIVSLVFAYMLNPVVELFQKWKVPRWVSALMLILLFVSGITLVLFFILPIALSQLDGVLRTLSALTDQYQLAFWNSNSIKVFERYGVSVNELRNAFASQLTPKFEDILKTLIRAFGLLINSISGFVTQIFYIILVPFLTFYFLTDFPKIHHRFLMLFPRTSRDRVEDFLSRSDDLIGHYLRGALLVALLQGLIISIIFSLSGIKYAMLLGLLACLFDLVPYFGLIAIMALSAVIALFSEPPTLMKLAIALVSIATLHMAEITFLSPKIIGSKVGLHPLLIILSLLIFLYFLGFIGLLIAVPTTALVVLFIRDWEARRRGTLRQPSDFS
jgi:predicted PurR-regulated permease PerM